MMNSIECIIVSYRQSQHQLDSTGFHLAINFKIGKVDTVQANQGEIISRTYLDSVIDQLHQNRIPRQSVLRLVESLKAQEFETESMDIDMQLSNNGGNISKYMMNYQRCMDVVIDTFNKSRRMFTPFEIYYIANKCHIQYLLFFK